MNVHTGKVVYACCHCSRINLNNLIFEYDIYKTNNLRMLDHWNINYLIITKDLKFTKNKLKRLL